MKTKIEKLFWYFVLFSIVGLFIETFYGYATMGIWESRKGLIWGPFCPVYGVGAVVLIFILDYLKPKNHLQLFIYGFFIGSIVEYLLSYGLEAFYGTRFWDYAHLSIDINGRICVLYSLFWGILAIFLMKILRPYMDRIIEKIPSKINGTLEITLFIFLVIDAIFTAWGIHTYEQRALNQYYHEKIQVEEADNIWSELKNKIENEYFTNERMMSIFPNLRIKDKEGNEIWIRDIIQ